MNWKQILKSPYYIGGESYREGKFPRVSYSKLYHGYQGQDIKNINKPGVSKYFSPNIYMSSLYAFLGWHEIDGDVRFRDKGKPRLIQLLPTKETKDLFFDFGIMGAGVVRRRPRKKDWPTPSYHMHQTPWGEKILQRFDKTKDFKELPSSKVKELGLKIIDRLKQNDSEMLLFLRDVQESAKPIQAINHINYMLEKYW